MGNFVDKITGKNEQGEDVTAQIKHSYLNDSGNLEISNLDIPGTESDSKVNIVSKDAIQIKPGDDGVLQLDCEQNTTNGDPVEFAVKFCNGNKEAGYTKDNRVVRSKINTAEIVIDNQNAHTAQTTGGSEDTFNINEIKVSFRTDKWKNSGGEPTRTSSKGPAEVKLRAKSFDIRCHGTAPGGGIALQPSGTDTNGKENKIKFESSRISELGAADPEYSTEGGKGLEFGTFNNEHTSLFTGDYRFNKDGLVYAATREPVETTPSGKVDYPTQEDDFKDVLDDKKAATWNDIVAAGKERTLVISKSGKVNPYKGPIVSNLHIPVYVEKSTGKLWISTDNLDTVYSAVDTPVVFSAEGWPSTAAVYTDAACTVEVAASSKLFLVDASGKYWIADINKTKQLKAYGDDSHDEVKELNVTTETLEGVTGYNKIESQGMYQIDENPVIDTIKNIITDPSVEDYSDFVAAMCTAFGWTNPSSLL